MINILKPLALTAIVLLLTLPEVSGQRFNTRNGTMRLTYRAPHGMMETVNRQVNAGLDVQTGEFRMQILMLSFRFNGAYHQEKFNEYFTENAHLANSSFRGKITNLDQIDFDRNGTYDVVIEGNLTLRGVSYPVTTTGEFTVNEGTFAGESVFTLPLRDFGINVPSSMEQNIQIAIELSTRRL